MSAAHRMYARALVDAAKERGHLTAVREELGDFVESAGQVPELHALLTNPEVDARARRAALEELLVDADELVRNFLLLLVEKGRTGELEAIHEDFEELVAAEEGRIAVELTTAIELSDEDAARIVHQIEEAAGRRVDATRRVDANLIGGIVLQAGSLRVDASVRGRLNRLRHTLARRS